MKLVIRILICIFSITMGFSNTLYATEFPLKNPEILDPQYVEIEVSNTNSVSISVLQSFLNLTQFIQTRYYSLLNWTTHTRSTLDIPNYERLNQFGPWINDPNDQVCYNTRAKVLVRDSKSEVFFKDNNRCVVEKGSWDEPYTNTEINIAREIQIDHLVPLKNAYLSGADKWSFKARCLYSNYLGYDFHLISAEGIQNMKKGDRAPDKYMPPNSNYACTYVRNWVAVKMMWGLSMTVNEANAIQQVILENNCSLTNFRISDAELRRQRKFAQDNIDLCEKFDKSHLNIN